MGTFARKVLRAFVVGAIATATTGLGEASDRAPREPSGLTPELRARGYNACYMPDPGFGAYSRWQRVGMGYMIVPLRGSRTEDGGFDVVIHFHGREAVRNAFVEVAHGPVL